MEDPPDQTAKVVVKDGHLQWRGAAAVYSVKRHFLSEGLVLLTGTDNRTVQVTKA
jgi:hypothetical protein